MTMRLAFAASTLAFLAAGLFPAASAGDGAVPVALTGGPDAWGLTRGGAPYFIQGAGGGGDKALLQAIGGNSFRTWGVGAKTGEELDEAQRHGLTVTVGFWLGHAAHGFDYGNADQLAKQKDDVRRGLERLKDHPAVLAWSMGNEMEIGVQNTEALWRHVNDLAKMAKEIDPHHPVMTVVADFGAEKIQAIHRWCPDVDIIGINSYGGGPSVAQRYRQAGGTKPYVLTEYGPNGTWEWRNTAWGAPLEPNSTEKAEVFYKNTYDQSIEAEKGKLCLGGYCFTWGYKVEGTPTWYGMLLPSKDGDIRLGVCDILQRFWTGRDPGHPCPRVKAFTLDADAAKALKPGAVFQAKFDYEAGGPARVEFELFKDSKEYRPYQGHGMPMPPSFPDAIGDARDNAATVTMPEEPGPYFLYARVFDGHGGAAVAMIPLLVEGDLAAFEAARPASIFAPKPAAWPFVLVGAAAADPAPYAASGYMGNTGAISMDPAHPAPGEDAGRTVLKVEYRARGDWGGVYWQSPANDWGEQPGGFDLTGAKRLAFKARGAKGGEKVKFLFGGLDQDKKYFDTAKGEMETTLTNAWKEYAFDLAGDDLRRIKSGFGWVLGGQGDGVAFFLDDVRYE